MFIKISSCMLARPLHLFVIWALLFFSVQNHAQICDNSGVPESTPDQRFEILEFDIDASFTLPFIVRDKQTKLEWLRCTFPTDLLECGNAHITYTWEQALKAASNFEFTLTPIGSSEAITYDDWRLPNIKELASIVELCNVSPTINKTFFPNTESSFYWSSSPYVGDSSNAWGINFDSGGDFWGNGSNNHYVRLVRSGQ